MTITVIHNLIAAQATLIDVFRTADISTLPQDSGRGDYGKGENIQ